MTPGCCAWIRSSSGQPAAAAITAKGLRTIGAALKAPYLNLNEYRHDVGVGWMWLAARDGAFGELSGLTSDRRMKAEDAATVSAGGRAQWGVGLGLLGAHGSPQHHYPDLMLETAERPPRRGGARAHEQERAADVANHARVCERRSDRRCPLPGREPPDRGPRHRVRTARRNRRPGACATARARRDRGRAASARHGQRRDSRHAR